MFDTALNPEHAPLLARLHSALDELTALDLTPCSDGEVLALWREMETCRRRFAPVDHKLISEVEQRHLDFVTGAKSIVVLARDVLRISVRQADARVRAAAALGPRRGLTGQVLAPIYGRVALAQARGTVAEDAARLIVTTIEKLPEQVRCEQDEQVEALLTEQAGILDPDGLRILARRLAATLDPDGLLRESDYRARHRDLRLQVRSDGSGRLEGELTAELTEHLRTVFDTLARPTPEGDCGKDPRTAGQRRHDALLDAVLLLHRTEALPHAGGISATVLLTMSVEAWTTGQGCAVTGHGTLIHAGQARHWAGGDARLIGVVLDRTKRVHAYGSSHRIFTENQRLAMIARDQGCSFPNCDAPPQWCESHHVTDYAQGGPTSVDNGTLLCGVHHRQFEHMGWSCRMLDGVPHWIPPSWIDAERAPIRNRTHDPVLV